jgi:hypothetical protein
MPSFTWWGGMIGAKILTHVKCCHCGKGYHGKSGRSNTVNIILYQIVGLVVAVVILILLMWGLG